jgi:hypothetical protein
MRDRELIIGIVAYLNNIIRQDIPYMEYYGIHTLAYVPRKTGKILQRAGYGLTTWHNLRVYTGGSFMYEGFPSYMDPQYYILMGSTIDLLTGAPVSVNNGVVPPFYNNVPIYQVADSAFNASSGYGLLTGTFDMSSVTNIGSRAFYKQTMTKVILRSNLSEILDYTFYSCPNLTDINLSNVLIIGDSAFSNCNALTTLDLSNVQSINDSAFLSCNRLTTVTLSSIPYISSTYISSNAFSGCSQLTTIDLSNVEHIGASAFFGCGLKTVDLSNVTYLGTGAFYGCFELYASVPYNIYMNSNQYFDLSANLSIAAPPTFFP